MKTVIDKKGSLIAVSVFIPKDLERFLRALYSFSKIQFTFEEWLGSKIAQSIQGDFSDNLESTLDINNIIHSYGLDKILEFKDC